MVLAAPANLSSGRAAAAPMVKRAWGPVAGLTDIVIDPRHAFGKHPGLSPPPPLTKRPQRPGRLRTPDEVKVGFEGLKVRRPSDALGKAGPAASTQRKSCKASCVITCGATFLRSRRLPSLLITQ